MPTLTARERVFNTLQRRPIDQLAASESFWGDTHKRWASQGQIRPDEDLLQHFNLDFRGPAWFKLVADLDFVPQVLEETAETVLTLDGNGAKLRRHKLHSSTPEHVDFTVKDRAGWEEHIKPRLLEPDRRRINFESYRDVRRMAAERNLFFTWSGVAPFECMHPVCGHEYMLMGMALDPEWVQDMVLTYANLTIKMQEILFAEEGKPDAVFYYEDMGFKGKPFMSPAMYEEIVQPGHKLLFDFAHSQGLPVFVHSCGFVEPLVPGLVAAGMDCLQAMEVKAGMDMHRLAAKYGDRLAFMGNLDVRELISNDRGRIVAELDRKIKPMVENHWPFILHSDHSVPPEVDHDSLVFWLEHGRALGRNCKW